MTNEEKSKELSLEFFETSVWHNDVKDALIIMAKWKDEQIINLIPKIITCVDQGLTNLIKGTENYEDEEI